MNIAEQAAAGEALGAENLRKLREQAFKFYRQLERLVQQRYNLALTNRFAMMNHNKRIRLLRLRTWALRYRVPVSFIMDVLVPYWHNRQGAHRKQQGTLGIPISQLTGTVSEQVLKRAIERNFPQLEHLDDWRTRRRTLYLRGSRTVQLVGLNPVQFVRAYQQEIHRRRKHLFYKMTVAYRRRRYPENPWI